MTFQRAVAKLCVLGLMTSTLGYAGEVVQTKALAAPESFRPPSEKPHLSDLYNCAQGIASSLFDRESNELMKWQASTGLISRSKEVSSVAVSVLSTPSSSPEFITVTPQNIFVTPARFHTEYNSAFRSNDRHVHLLLNLRNQLDPQRGLPIVDPRDNISPSWYFDLNFDQSERKYVIPWRRYGTSELRSPTEVKGADALTGEKGVKALERLQSILHERLKGTAERLESIANFRAHEDLSHSETMYMVDGPPITIRHQYSEHFFRIDEITEIRLGLCSCDGASTQADEVRKKITDPQSNILEWDTEKNEARKVRPDELDCGMI